MLSNERIIYYLDSSLESLQDGEYEQLADHYFRAPKSDEEGTFAKWGVQENIEQFWRLIRKYPMQETGNIVDFSGFHFPEFQHLTFWSKDEEREFSAGVNFYEATFTKYVTFHNVAFAGGCRFSKATFSEGASFDGASFFVFAEFNQVAFNGVSNFMGSYFQVEVSFDNTAFVGDATFLSEFSDKTSFSKARFFKTANFMNTKLGAEAQFDSVEFHEGIIFTNTQFSSKTSFDHAIFLTKGKFSKVIFSGSVSFYDVTFSQGAVFLDVTFSDKATFFSSNFLEDVIFASTTFSDVALFNHTSFLKSVSFLDATFTKEASFSQVTFWGETLFRRAKIMLVIYFTETRFSEKKTTLFESLETEEGDAPTLVFQSIVLNNNIEFRNQKMVSIVFILCEVSEVRFRSCVWDLSKRAQMKFLNPDKEGNFIYSEEFYRQLKKNFKNVGDYSLAGRAYMLEMELTKWRLFKERRFFEWFIYWFYGFFGGYTNSLARPLLSLCAILVLGVIGYYFVDFSWEKSIQRSLYASMSFLEIFSEKPFHGYWLLAQNTQSFLSSIFIIFFVLALRKRFKT